MRTTIPTSWALYVIFIASFIVFLLPSPDRFFASKNVANGPKECEACSSVCAPGLECSSTSLIGAVGTLCVRPGDTIDSCLVVDEPPVIPIIPIGKPTPSSGCYYLQVQCVTAPCDPVLVCPQASPTCRPRPQCLDQEPRCLMPETEDMCPPSTDPSPGYTCPDSEWVDCMPGPGPQKPMCQSDYLAWAQANCPGFQGAAY